MRESYSNSLKLNRDLERYLERALEQGRPVKIGWGRAGDERPKNGEFGVMTHLPEGARVLCLGNLGECVGAVNKGGNLTLRGSSGSMFGAFQVSGRTLVERDVGNRAGFRMEGGEISIQGSAGDETGAGMSGGVILVRGHAGDSLGVGMSGGTILVMGSVGTDPGIGMTGGKAIISGSCPPPPNGVEMRSIEKSEISEFSEFLEPMGLSLNEDALVLESNEKMSKDDEIPESFICEGFEKISLVPNEDASPEFSTLDYSTLLSPKDSDSEGILLPIPWLVSCEKPGRSKFWKEAGVPAVVRKKPREIDFLLVGRADLSDSIDHIGKCAGLIFDVSDFPGLNDAEVEALLVSLRSRMADSSMIFLRGNIDRLERLFRLILDFDLDGAVVDCASISGSRLASTLPRIGLASKAMGLTGKGKFVMMEITNAPDSKDLVVAIASGFSAIVSPPEEGGLEMNFVELEKSLRGWMRELGIDSLDRIGRRNLRAVDFDTASISGLRLIGYDRPLKMWLELG